MSTFSGPVAPERLVTTSAMYSIGDLAHPDLRPLYDAMGARLAGQARREGWPERVFAVLPDTYHAHNKYLLSSLLGHRLDLVVARADVPRTAERFSGASYRSSFAVDLDQEGRWLRHVLEELDQNV